MPKWLKIKSIPLLIISCLASIVIWLVVMSSLNPEMTIRFYDLDVTIKGTTELYEKNSFSILSNTDFSFDVEFTGGRNSILRLKRSDIDVICDVSRISSNGTNRVQCTVETPYEDIRILNEASLVAAIEVDKIVEQPIKLRYELNGELPENYILGTVSLPDEQVFVSGPATEISKIAYGLVTADISGLRNSESRNLPVTLIGTNGEPVVLEYTQQITKNVDLNIPVLLIKDVSFSYTVNSGGGLTNDDVEISVSPSYVTLIGDPVSLSETESISLGTIDLSGIGEGVTYDEAFWIPEGTQCTTERSTVTVNIAVKDVETRTYQIDNIQPIGYVDGFEAFVITNYLNVRLRGNKNVLDSVTIDDFVANVSLDNIPAKSGNHSVKAVVSFAPSLNVEQIPADYRVIVKLISVEPIVPASFEPDEPTGPKVHETTAEDDN